MTKGVVPKELIAELKRNKSAPAFEEDEEDSLPSGPHPLDILQRGRKGSDSLAQSSSLPPKDSSKELLAKQSGLMSKASGVDFDTLSSAQVTYAFVTATPSYAPLISPTIWKLRARESARQTIPLSFPQNKGQTAQDFQKLSGYACYHESSQAFFLLN